MECKCHCEECCCGQRPIQNISISKQLLERIQKKEGIKPFTGYKSLMEAISIIRIPGSTGRILEHDENEY